MPSIFISYPRYTVFIVVKSLYTLYLSTLRSNLPVSDVNFFGAPFRRGYYRYDNNTSTERQSGIKANEKAAIAAV